MSAVGWAVLPITPSLRGLGAQLNKELMEPARKAAQSAASGIEKSMADAAKKASADVAKARQAEQKAAEAVTAAEKKLADQRSSAQRDVKSIESAELKLTAAREKGARDVAAAEKTLADARSSGDVAKAAEAESRLAEVRARTGSTVLDRENALARAREKSVSNTDKIAAAEKNVATAKDKAVEASENVISSTKRLDQAQSATTSEFEAARAELGRFQDELGRTGGEMDKAAEKSGGFGAKVREGLGKIGTGALLGVGAKIGSTLTSGFGTALTKGFDRLAAIDQAKAALSGLGHSAESVQVIMDSAMEAVKGTAFGFGDAAGLAGTLVASGIAPGEELTRILSLVGDTAAITGSDLGDMGSIWAKVAAGGKMSTEEMNQLLDRGLGILPALSEQYGVTGEEMRKMISEGKVGFDDFAQVMEGVVGGSAVTMGDTFKGSFDNMGAALGRFGAQLLGPIFDNAPTVFAAVSEAVDGLGERLEPLVAEFSERLAPIMADFAERIGPAITAALNGLFDALATTASAAGALVGFIRDNQTWLIPLTAAVVAATGAYKLLALQQKIAAAGGLLAFIKNLTIVTKLQTIATTAQATAQRILNTVMKANPIMLIVSAVAILATALWAFFTKTETGRKMWSNFMDALEPAKRLFSDLADFGRMVADILFRGEFNGEAPFGLEEDSGLVSFLFGIRDAVSKVGEVISNVFGWIIDNWQLVVSLVFGPLGIVISQAITHWDTLKSAVMSIIDTLISVGQIIFAVFAMPFVLAWQAISTIVTWAWDTVIRPAWEGMKISLAALGTFFQWIWTAIIQPAWNALGAGIAFVWTSIINPAWNALKTALGAVGTFFQWVWNSVIKPAWDALGNGIRLVIDSVIRPAFDGMKSALQSVGDFFGTIVGGIQRVWDQLRGHVARPINFVIDTVWNNGLVRAWNTIADFLPGLPRASTLSPVAFATGGAVYGPGTATSDSIPARLSAGEHVLTAAEVKAFGGHDQVYAMRKMAMNGVWPMGHGPDAMPKFADGGEVGTGVRLAPTPGEGGLQAIAILAKRLIHRIWPSITTIGGYRGEDGYGEHSSGRALDVMVGVGNPIGDEVTSWALANDPVIPLQHAIWKQQMWYPGVDGGSMMEDRGNPTQNHYDHPHLWYKNVHMDPNVVPEGLVGHDGLTREDRLSVIKDKISEIIDKMMDPLIDGMSAAIGDPPPEWLGIMPKVADKSKDGAVDAAFDFVEKIGDDLRDVYNAAREVKNIVVGRITGLWRDEGGFIPTGQSIVTNETGRPEAVLNWQQLERVREILGSLSSLSELQFLADVMARMATTGTYDPRASRFGIDSEDDELVQALWAVRAQWMLTAAEMGKVFQSAGQKAATGYRDEALDFFGFKGLHDDLTGLWGELNPAPGAAAGAASTVTSGISGPVTDATTDLVYGNPSVRLELEEVELETKMPDLDAGTAGTGPVADQVREAMAAHGWDSGPQWEAVDWIINKESTWNPTAQNPTSTAYGLFQFLDTTWPTVGATKTDNPKLQAEAGAAYIKQRYGDPLGAKRFWEANGWYDRGGLAFGKGLMAKGTLSPERVLSPAQTAAFESWMASGAAASVIDASHWQAIDSLLESLPSAAQFARVAALGDSVAVPAVVERVQASPLQAPAGWSGQSGPLVHIENQYAMDAEEAAREQMREARRASRSAGLVGGWQ